MEGMTSTRRRRSLGAIFLGVAWLISVSSAPKKQTSVAAPPEDFPFTIRDNVNLVLLDVSVLDPKGGFVSDLNKSNFKIVEDGKSQVVAHFENLDVPVTVGLVVDNSGSMRTKRPEVVMAGLAFAKESNPKDEFFVVNFNNYVVQGLGERTPFTDSLQKLRSALYLGDPAGQTALYDAIIFALKHLELSKQEKRTLIVVSDGGDNVSKYTLPELMEIIESSRATIYTVGLYDADDRDKNPNVLRRIAAVSGGQFFEPAILDNVIPVFHKISQDIRHRYTIGYVPELISSSSKAAVRQIRVSASSESRRKCIVRTRTSYSIKAAAELIAQQRSKETGSKDK